MTVWKSPVLYFGILLVVVVAGLLAAPFVVEWNSYRDDLESYGRKLTGRKVEVMGNISVRLFPWPRLTVEDVRIANLPGLEAPHLATAQRMVVSLTLAGLARGVIDVLSIDVERPVIHLERLATGEGNWQLHPAEDLLQSRLLDRVSLDSIVLHDATLRFADRRRGEVHLLEDVDGDISAPGLAGPWRVRATADHRGERLALGVSSGVWKPGEPFRIGLRMAPADGSGAAFIFDGAIAAGKAAGTLRIEPAGAPDGRSNPDGTLPPLVLSARAEADFDVVTLDSIEIGPSDPRQGGALVTGAARLELGQHITATTDLSAAMLDLDQMAGDRATSRQLLRSAVDPAVVRRFFEMMPADLNLDGRMKVTALRVGSQTLDMVNLKFAANSGRIEIAELSAGLPGRSRLLFHGTLLPSPTGPELAGSLALESNDLRQLSFWASPEFQSVAEPLWTGSRGRMKLQTDVSASRGRVRLSEARYELDDEAGSGEFLMTTGGRTVIDLRIDGGRFDVDSFMPGGLPALSGTGGTGLANLFGLALPRAGAPDVRLTLQTGEIVFNGVSARDVALDLASGANGLDLRTLSIGSVGGARLEGMGLILDAGGGADGAVDLDVAAQDPRDLLRLLGLIRGEPMPAWAEGLGPTAVKVHLGVKPGEKGPALSLGLQGTVDELVIEARGAFAEDGVASGEVVIDSATSARLARLVGWSPRPAQDFPGRIEIRAAGSTADGYMASMALQAYGARADYNGSINPLAAGFGLDGRLTVRTTDAGPIVAAVGLPLQKLPQDVLVLDGRLAYDDGRFVVSGIDGRLGSAPIRGEAELATDGRVTATLETGTLVLADVLAASFLDWTGPAPNLDTPFRTALPLGLSGEIWIRPSALSIHSRFMARDAQVGITARDGEIRLALFAKDADGRDAQIDVVSRGQGMPRTIEGHMRLPIDLQHHLRQVDGSPVAAGDGLIEVRFTGEGRSPGGTLASVRGSGTYRFETLRLLGLSPADFASALAAANDAAGISAAFDRLRGGPGIDIGTATGAVTINNGAVAFQSIAVSRPEADVMIRAAAEPSLGELSADVELLLKARDGLPAMTVSYRGPPTALARSEDNAKLATMLGVTLMQQGVDELERLQEEQRRLAEEEERQRIEDEARLQAYYAQRDELLLRRRELKVHAEMRLLAAERLRRRIEAEQAANAEINRLELRQRMREVRVHRQLARLATRQQRSQPATSEPVPRPAAQAPAPRPKPQTAAPSQSGRLTSSSSGAVVLEQPEGAPVIISPPPSASPSQ